MMGDLGDVASVKDKTITQGSVGTADTKGVVNATLMDLSKLTIMEDAQLIVWVVAFIAGLISAIIAIRTFQNSIDERKADLAWRQANASRELVKELHENSNAIAAVSMLDWFSIDQPDNYDKSRMIEINYEEVLVALPKLCVKNFTDKEHYILQSFDWFFYYIDRMEQYIQDGLITFNNVKYIFWAYYKKINANEAIYYKFMDERNLVLAHKFWDRYKTDNDFDTTKKQPSR